MYFTIVEPFLLYFDRLSIGILAALTTISRLRFYFYLHSLFATNFALFDLEECLLMTIPRYIGSTVRTS